MSAARAVEIRVPANLVGPLRSGVAWTPMRESVVFGLASHVDCEDRLLLLVRRLVPLPQDAYIASREHGAVWRGRSMLPVLNAALAEQLGVIVFHSHPHDGPVALSSDDRRSAAELLSTFDMLMPPRPHASVVLGADHSAGVVNLPDDRGQTSAVRVRMLGQTITELPSVEWPHPASASREEFHRQTLLTGSAGEAAIRRAKVAVVGLSGGGGHVVQQLTHMGIGEIIGIDADRAERPNRSRLIGMAWWDAIVRRRKTSIMRRTVRRINPQVKFTAVPENIPSQRAIDALKRADIIVGCVDTYHARSDVQELAWRYLIPYVDIGLLIRTPKEDDGITIGGNVISAIPGHFCQWCIGFLSTAKLKAETGDRPRSYLEESDKQAQVVSMNGVLASGAVSEVLQLLTGFAPVSDDYEIKKFDGLSGTLERWAVKKSPTCAICAHGLGAGDPIWIAA